MYESAPVGNVFHGYMEYLVLSGTFGKQSDNEVGEKQLFRIAAKHQLAKSEQSRLLNAARTWHSSDLSTLAATYENRVSELPFYIRFDIDAVDTNVVGKPIFLLAISTSSAGMREARVNCRLQDQRRAGRLAYVPQQQT